VAEARALIDEMGASSVVEVDGGISVATAPRALAAGAQLLVSGSAILGHPEGKAAAVAEIRSALDAVGDNDGHAPCVVTELRRR
jgi:ribulose-phosphate 3-epimerase